MARSVVVAIGGNALQRRDDNDRECQATRISSLCGQLVGMTSDGYRIAVTHGNGPQVGDLLFGLKLAGEIMSPFPLDEEVAHTQGQLGYLIAQELQNELMRQGRGEQVVSIVTRVVVTADDPAWRRPTKPVGLPVPTSMMRKLGDFEGAQWRQTTDELWQLLVPSPEPQEILEYSTVRALLEAGKVVVACGGGGIPVVRSEDGTYRGGWAVIDKDYTAQRLASSVGADVLLILASVPGVMLGFAGRNPRLLRRVAASELRMHQQAMEFPAGTMGPKVEAALRFLDAGGSAAIIGPIDRARDALRGELGTWILPDVTRARALA